MAAWPSLSTRSPEWTRQTPYSRHLHRCKFTCLRPITTLMNYHYWWNCAWPLARERDSGPTGLGKTFVMIGFTSRSEEPMRASGNLPSGSTFKRRSRPFTVRAWVRFEGASSRSWRRIGSRNDIALCRPSPARRSRMVAGPQHHRGRQTLSLGELPVAQALFPDANSPPPLRENEVAHWTWRERLTLPTDKTLPICPTTSPRHERPPADAGPQCPIGSWNAPARLAALEISERKPVARAGQRGSKGEAWSWARGRRLVFTTDFRKQRGGRARARQIGIETVGALCAAIKTR